MSKSLPLNQLKKEVQNLLAEYQTNAKQEEEQKQAYQSHQNQLFDRLDSLKNKQAKAQSLENILKTIAIFMRVSRVFSKKKITWVVLLEQLVNI